MGQRKEKYARGLERRLSCIVEDVDALKRERSLAERQRREAQVAERKQARKSVREKKQRTHHWVLAWIVLCATVVLAAVFLTAKAAEPLQEDLVKSIRHVAPLLKPDTITNEGPGPLVDEAALIDAALVQQQYFRDDVPLPFQEQDFLQTACVESGVPYPLALAVVEKETQFSNIASPHGDCIGYMQIMPKWHEKRMRALGVDNLFDPYSNFRVGCSYLAELLGQYDLDGALSVYKSGTPDRDIQYSRAVQALYAKWESVLNDG